MCDHAHFDDLEKRVKTLETYAAVTDERIRGLVAATSNLKCILYAFTLILLLTVVYGAIGRHGFNAVTQAANAERITK